MSALALQACPTLPLAQAWWLGTHRRMDLLDVPSFHADRLQPGTPVSRVTQRRRLHRLPTALPVELLGLEAYLAGASAAATGPLQGLSQLLRHLAAPLTWQADNPYGVHRAVPSPRCANPCRVVVLERHATGVRSWSYEGDHHALTPIDSACDAGAVLGPHRLAIVGIARHWVLADKYGDFAPFNSMLEAGMAQAQLQHLAAALGWHGDPLEHDPAALRAALALCDHPLESVAYGLRVSAWKPADDAWPGAGVDTDVASLEPSPRLMRQFDRLPQLAAQFSAIGPAASGASPVADVALPAAARARGLLAVMRSRSAGNDRPGLAPLLTPLPASARSELLALWRALAARRGSLAGEGELEPFLLWLEEHHGAAALYDLQGRPRPLPAGARPRELLRDALPSVRVRHNVAGLKCHVLWCADLGGAATRHGAAALRRIHLAAGAQAQDFSLAAAALGLFARPVRMLREGVLEGGLGLPGPLAYQVMCGLNRSTNTHWNL